MLRTNLMQQCEWYFSNFYSASLTIPIFTLVIRA